MSNWDDIALIRYSDE